jgi:transcriptional regulator with XRE-family HTH domain
MKMAQAFPNLLKHWRNTRRMSQLDLGLAANVSARHVSFLETGRAAPSRSMVLQLCETLDVPLPAQNTLLHAAGFAEVFRNRQWNDAELAQAKQAVEWTLQRHDPFPAMALDKHWTIIKANRAATLLLSAVGLAEGDSLLEAMQNSKRLKAAIVNWQEVLRHMITRLRTESAKLGNDDVFGMAATQLALQLTSPAHEVTAGNVVLSTRYTLNGMELSFFSMLAQFSSAEDIALADLRIELMYPADEPTRSLLLSLEKLSPPSLQQSHKTPSGV